MIAVINKFNGTMTGFYDDDELSEMAATPWQHAAWLLLEAQAAGALAPNLYVVGVTWMPTEDVFDDRPFVVFTAKGPEAPNAKTRMNQIKKDLDTMRSFNPDEWRPEFVMITGKKAQLDPIDAVFDTVALIQASAQAALDDRRPNP